MIQKLLPDTRVLICRPEPSGSDLSKVLESVGANCEVLPTLMIQPLDITAEARQKIMNIDDYDHVIVVSQHAARLGLSIIDEYWPQFPIKQNWFAIGRKTANTLKPAGLNLIEPGEDLNSEALLTMKLLTKVSNEKVLILKGKEGRNIIENVLEKRGAYVDTISLYERICPQYSAAELENSLIKFNPNYIVALSGETLSNLIVMSKNVNIDLKNKVFILSSERVANIARDQGYKLTYIANNLMPMDIIRCIAKARKEIH
ncbi:MAG: uroporphyrinogen-III synthase [Oleiphilaceae bacterium]|jgi:uroporphyrinogen-III synthase